MFQAWSEPNSSHWDFMSNFWSLCAEFSPWKFIFGIHTHTHTDGDEKKEWDMCAALSYLWGSNDHYEYEKLESNLEVFFSYFVLTAKVPLCSNEAGWRCLLVVERQPYRRSILICLTKSSSYSVCSTLSLCIWGRLRRAWCWVWTRAREATI